MEVHASWAGGERSRRGCCGLAREATRRLRSHRMGNRGTRHPPADRADRHRPGAARPRHFAAAGSGTGQAGRPARAAGARLRMPLPCCARRAVTDAAPTRPCRPGSRRPTGAGRCLAPPSSVCSSPPRWRNSRRSAWRWPSRKAVRRGCSAPRNGTAPRHYGSARCFRQRTRAWRNCAPRSASPPTRRRRPGNLGGAPRPGAQPACQHALEEQLRQRRCGTHRGSRPWRAGTRPLASDAAGVARLTTALVEARVLVEYVESGGDLYAVIIGDQGVRRCARLARRRSGRRGTRFAAVRLAPPADRPRVRRLTAGRR